MRKTQRGVSLVELVVVMTIIGVLSSIAVTMVTRVASGQQGNRDRLTLAVTADAAIARVADEVQAALPNSVRLISNVDGVWIEWVPVVDAGRYRGATDTVNVLPGDPLDLADASDNQFDVIGTAIGNPAGSVPAGSSLVVQNLGAPEADVYLGTSRRAGVVLTNAGRHVAFTANDALPNSTNTQRFFITSTPVTLACVAATGGLFDLVRYSNYGWQSAQPASLTHAAWAGATRVLVLGSLGSCSASYSAALANMGLMNLRLSLGAAGSPAHMDFLQQLAIDNTP